jgi:hypothetical protein
MTSPVKCRPLKSSHNRLSNPGTWPHQSLQPIRFDRSRASGSTSTAPIGYHGLSGRAGTPCVATVKPAMTSCLQYLSPLGWEHINLTGDYLWRSSAKIGAGKFRPLGAGGLACFIFRF